MSASDTDSSPGSTSSDSVRVRASSAGSASTESSADSARVRVVPGVAEIEVTVTWGTVERGEIVVTVL